MGRNLGRLLRLKDRGDKVRSMPVFFSELGPRCPRNTGPVLVWSDFFENLDGIEEHVPCACQAQA